MIEPPLAAKVKYRLWWSIPEEYRAWVERDVASSSFIWWHLLATWSGYVVATILLTALIPSYQPVPMMIGWAIGSVIVVIFFRDYVRRRALRSHEKRWNSG